MFKRLKRFVVIAATFFLCIQGIPFAQLTVGQAVDREWDELIAQITKVNNWTGPDYNRIKAEALDTQALVMKTDKDPLVIVHRRTGRLLSYFRAQAEISSTVLENFQTQYNTLSTSVGNTTNAASRRTLFNQMCALRRNSMFASPLLDFDSLVCNRETFIEGRFVECARAGFYKNGGGPVLITNFKGAAKVSTVISGINISSGAYKGNALTGKFSGIEMSFDGKEMLFSATTNTNYWHVFKYNLITKQLVQLTDGAYDDFDPCFLPSGRIVFTSTRRGGIGRCLLPQDALTATLYSIEDDGSDLFPISYHETNDWQASVNNDGMLVYTRWDYLDRHWGAGHHLWLCAPDGTDPRNYHGNYALPYSAFPFDVQPAQYGQYGTASQMPYGRSLRPDAEIGFRAIPGASSRYVATAMGHHEGFSGTLVKIDVNIPDDGKMAQVKRITPMYTFPEVEGGSHTYATPWPLSEDFYLCGYTTGLYLLDKFGNRELIYDPNQAGWAMMSPFPLKARTKPPTVSVKTWQGKRANSSDHLRATLGVLDCRIGDIPLPAGAKPKWMRIIQVIPQMLTNGISEATIKYIGFCDESMGRMPLGIVPVEDDGSIYCEAPVGKAFYMQLLDSNGLAIQSMRSITYVHPGEQLNCTGCHENKWSVTPTISTRKAFTRAPSKIITEVESGAIPFNYYNLVKKPVFDKKCVGCHASSNPKGPDMSYSSLSQNRLAFALPGEVQDVYRQLGVGGSRTTPGRFGAQASGLWKALMTKEQHKDVVSKLTAEERKRISLWLDCNSNEICFISNNMADINTQRQGNAFWPTIDVDKNNPLGVENDFPVGAVNNVKKRIEHSHRITTTVFPTMLSNSTELRFSWPGIAPGPIELKLFSPNGKLISRVAGQAGIDGLCTFVSTRADKNIANSARGMVICKVSASGQEKTFKLYKMLK